VRFTLVLNGRGRRMIFHPTCRPVASTSAVADLEVLARCRKCA
jgi:hypothetical protein